MLFFFRKLLLCLFVVGGAHGPFYSFVRLEFKQRFYVYFNYARGCHFEARLPCRHRAVLQPVAQLYAADK